MQKAICLGICLLILHGAVAQNNVVPRSFSLWPSLGAGPVFNGPPMLGMRAALNAAFHQTHFITAQYQFTFELEGIPFGERTANHLVASSNISLLYGKQLFRYQRSIWIGSAGISTGKGRYRGDFQGYTVSGGFGMFGYRSPTFDSYEFRYIGLPLSFKMLRPGQNTGFSMDIYVNVHRHADGGFIFAWELGKIRSVADQRKL